MHNFVKKLLSMTLACLVGFSGQLIVPVYAYESDNSYLLHSSLNKDMTGIRIPDEIGEIQETFNGNEKRVVVLIQDAHSIPDAQKSIRGLLDFFDEKYGLDLTLIEGAAGELDAQFFRSFPDTQLMKNVFKNYLDKGELTGPTAAAIFGQEAGNFVGIENWDLYQDEVEHFLKAMENESRILKMIEEYFFKLAEQKRALYSQKLLKVDHAVTAFRHNQIDLVQLLKTLNEIQAPLAGSRIEAILKATQFDDSAVSLEIEVKSLATRVKKLLASMNPEPGMFHDQEILNLEYQKFRTSQSSPEVFGLVLQKMIQKYRMPLDVSEQLKKKASYQKKIQDIKGTQLFNELENYIREVKLKLFETSSQKQLDQENSYLELIEDLARLELSQEQWVSLLAFEKELATWTIRQADGVEGQDLTKILDKLDANLRFYEVARKRDKVFAKKALDEMNDRQKEQAVLVAGGFHTEGLMQELKSQGVSYILVTPKIQAMPEKINYRDHMQGKVSWQKYFEVKNGRVNLYEAFVRGTRDLLLKGSKEQQGVLLKKWRDQIIRDLAGQGRIEKAAPYLSFIDEVLDEDQDRTKLKNQWLESIDNFMERVGILQGEGKLDTKNVLSLMQPSVAAEAALAGALGRNELRANLLPIIPQKEFSPARAELRALNIQNTPAYELIKTFELEDTDKYALSHEIQIDKFEGRVDLNSSTQEKTKIYRTGILNTRARGELPKTGLEVLVEELFQKKRGAELQSDFVDVDLLYAADGRLLGIFPTQNERNQALLDSKIVKDLFYFDLSSYYFEIPEVGDEQALLKWQNFSKQHNQDRETIQAFLKKQNEDMGIDSNAPYFSKSYNRQEPLHAPYLYLEVDQQNGSVSKVRAFWPDKFDPTRYNEKRAGYHQIILPIFPSVYSPGVDFNLASDLSYYNGIGKMNLSPKDKVLVTFAGSGIDTVLAFLRMTKYLEDPRSTDIVIDVIDANPLAIANVKEMARLAGFKVRAVVNDNVFLKNGDRVFGDKTYRVVFANMPLLKPGAETAHETLRVGDLHDGDSGKTLKRFAEELLRLLEPETGQALIWAVPFYEEKAKNRKIEEKQPEREKSKDSVVVAFQTAGGLFPQEGQSPLEVSVEMGITKGFVYGVYTVGFRIENVKDEAPKKEGSRHELRTELTAEDFRDISFKIADKAVKDALAGRIPFQESSPEVNAENLVQSVEQQGLEMTKQRLKEAVVMAFLQSRKPDSFVWTDEALEVLRDEAKYLIASLEQLGDRTYTLAATLPESGDVENQALFKQLLKVSEDENTFSEFATNGALPVSLQTLLNQQDVRSRSVSNFKRSFMPFNEQPIVPLLMLNALKKIDALFVPFQNDLSTSDGQGEITDPMLIDFSELLRSVAALHMVDLVTLDASLLKEEKSEELKQALATRLSRFGADFNQMIVKDENGWTLKVDAERIYLEMQIAQITKSSA